MRRISTPIAGLALAAVMMFATSAQAATAVDLGTADGFAVLGGSGVTNTGPSIVNGDLGTSPNPSITGFGGAPNGTVNGVVHQADAVAAAAQADLTTAYNNAAGQGPVNTVATELGGQTLAPGVYNSSAGTFGITGTVTLDAQGDPDSVFIFNAASTLITASASQVQLINGAQPCRVYWRVGSSATLGTTSSFAGNLMALQSISLNNGVTANGRMLARNGAVTLINGTVTRSDCAPGTSPPPLIEPPGGGPGGGGGNPGGGGGNPGGGGGNPGGGNPGAGGPEVQIPQIPGTGEPSSGSRCVSKGFRADFRIRSQARLRSVKVFVDGDLIKETTAKKFSVFIRVRGLRDGTHSLRVVATDVNGRREVAREKFGRCAPTVADPDFTGRVAG